VHIGVRHEPGRWRLSFRDNDIGIEPVYFDRIFVMFQRLHLRSEHPGTGIGLAICKRVAERHGGTITVESEPGHGTTFHVTLADDGRAHVDLPEVAAATTP
jgi:signal transduction histidine kinase